MTETNPTRLLATIHGHVQGVGYRMFVERTAKALGLTGWVRNRWNGDVEVLVEGERPVLEKLLTRLHDGPRSAVVDNIEVEWLPATLEFMSFLVKTTA